MCPTVFHPLKFSSLQQMAHANGVNFLKTLTRFKLNFKLFSISSLAPGGLATRSYIVRQRVYTYCCHFFFFFFGRAAHMKIVFLLFSRLTGENISFSCVHIWNIFPAGRYFFWRAVRQEKPARKQYSKWMTQTWKNIDQCCYIWTYQGLIL